MFSLRIDDSLLGDARRRASELETSVTALIEAALRVHLAEMPPRRKPRPVATQQAKPCAHKNKRALGYTTLCNDCGARLR